jgi:hypothetical protein
LGHRNYAAHRCDGQSTAAVFIVLTFPFENCNQKEISWKASGHDFEATAVLSAHLFLILQNVSVKVQSIYV